MGVAVGGWNGARYKSAQKRRLVATVNRINANSPMPLRRQVWGKIAGSYRPTRLDRIAHCIALEQLPKHLALMLAGRLRERTVIRMRS